MRPLHSCKKWWWHIWHNIWWHIVIENHELSILPFLKCEQTQIWWGNQWDVWGLCRCRDYGSVGWREQRVGWKHLRRINVAHQQQLGLPIVFRLNFPALSACWIVIQLKMKTQTLVDLSLQLVKIIVITNSTLPLIEGIMIWIGESLHMQRFWRLLVVTWGLPIFVVCISLCC